MTTVKNMSALAEPPTVGTIPLESGGRLTRAELAAVLDTLGKGLAAPEHDAFVERLSASDA